jgi:hypothetical protein
MKSHEFIIEGGWTSTVTQSTTITPAVVRSCLSIMQKFTNDFNKYLSDKGLGPVLMGKPTGSTSYHEIDAPDKVYGDIDLQMIGPEMEQDSTHSQYTAYWNKLADEFIKTHNLNYIHPTESKLGHPIVEYEPNKFVQVDFMWNPKSLSTWGAARVTPERGVKGLLYGNMFSSLGEILDMSIQHVGVQLKVTGDVRVPFSKRKDTQVITITIDPEHFILDIFNWIADRQSVVNPHIDQELLSYPGINVKNVKISDLVHGVKGFAKSCQENNMFGKDDLNSFVDDKDFINKFISRYIEKAELDINNSKRDKAETPEAIAKANSDREKVRTGLDMVLKLFNQ